MKHVVVDIEANGPYPPTYSMIQLGAVCFEDRHKDFLMNIAPIGPAFLPEATAVHGISHEYSLLGVHPELAMIEFTKSLESLKSSPEERILFVSDNAGFDWMFVNYYLHHFTGSNPFGHSPMSLTWLYKGFSRTRKANMRQLRDTKHDHNALHDARGNAEVLQKIVDKGYEL